MNFQTQFSQHGHQTMRPFLSCLFDYFDYFVDSPSYLKPQLVLEKNNQCTPLHLQLIKHLQICLTGKCDSVSCEYHCTELFFSASAPAGCLAVSRGLCKRRYNSSRSGGKFKLFMDHQPSQQTENDTRTSRLWGWFHFSYFMDHSEVIKHSYYEVYGSFAKH